MKKACLMCGQPLKRGKKYCSDTCKGKSMKGRHPWNYGLTIATDPRVKQNIQATAQTLKKMHAEGILKPWIKGRTKETEPILQKVAEENSFRTHLQYLQTGKDKWIADRPGFIRKGRKNSEKQKQATRSAMLRSLFTGKIKLKKSKQEIQVQNMLEQLNIVFLEVLIEDIGIPDFFLPDYNTMLFVDGIYFHSLESVIKRDKWQTEQIKALDFNVVRWDENKVKSFNNNPEILKQALEKEVKKID